MGSKTVILVTGATGMAGSEVTAKLAQVPGVEVRAGLHSPEKRQMLPGGVTPVPLDTDDPATVSAALDGVSKLFLLTPGGPPGPPSTGAIMEAAKNSSLEGIVKLSSFDPYSEPQAPTDLWALETEAMVRDSGVPYTFLRPPWFDQNFTLGYFVPMVMQNFLALPFGEGRAAWVDTRDIASMVTAALLDDSHAGKIYTPTGPETISLAEIAHILSDVVGKEIRYQHLTDDQWVEAMLAAGRAEVDARATLALISKTRDGHATQVTDDVEHVTGEKPRSFEQFARDHAEVLTAFANTPMPPGPPASA